MADKLYRLDQIQPEHLTLVGYKALYLSHLLQKNLPAMPGFVISAGVCRDFLEAIDWPDPLFADIPNSSLRLDIDNPRQLQAIAQQLQQTIESAPLPTDLLPELESAIAELAHPMLILRPSLVVEPIAAPSAHRKQIGAQIYKTAGLMNIQVCQAEGNALAQGLKRLWSELFGAKSLFYWQRSGIHLQQVHLAVLVQPIQPAIAAGVVHTTGTHFQIQAAPGLGMAIAWGEVIPDTYQVDAETGVIQAQQQGCKTIAYTLSSQSQDVSDRHPEALGDAKSQGWESIEIGSPTVSGSSQPLPAPVSAIASRPLIENSAQPSTVVLEAQILDDHQQQYALSEGILKQLIQLVQTAVTTMGSLLELEWVLWNEDSPVLYLTQATPQPAIRRKPEVPTPQKSQREEAGQFSSSSSVGENRVPTPSAEIPLVVAGLAASGGQAIAHASLIMHSHEPPQNIPPGTVLVAPTLPLDWLPLIRQRPRL
ncbi:MAG: hypothetical protein HC866_14825 [Leptolyngbyaceae cyanobacterium RU_5_1]|nr:hypothetical protein [Leptolyngbyaceae cyanobacterium RU_5_1]